MDLNAFSQNKNFLFFIAILVGVLIGLSVIGFINFFKRSSNYYAVALSNGSIYFGKLSTFPRLKIEKALSLSFDEQGRPWLQRFKTSIWQPEGSIYLNKDNVILIAPIDKKSFLIDIIENRSWTDQPLIPLQPGGAPTIPQQPIQIAPESLPTSTPNQ